MYACITGTARILRFHASPEHTLTMLRIRFKAADGSAVPARVEVPANATLGDLQAAVCRAVGLGDAGVELSMNKKVGQYAPSWWAGSVMMRHGPGP